jgi:hypothetical protein
MMHDPLLHYELAKAQQRKVLQEAERDRQIKEAHQDQLPLVERVLQTVWKRLGLPKTSPAPQPSLSPSGKLSALS